MSRKAVFLDVDGTLVETDGRIPVSAVAAVRAARAAGHLVFLCTGRSSGEIWPELASVGFDGLIGIAGAYIEVQGEVLAHHTFSPAQVEAVVSLARSRGIDYYFQGTHRIFGGPGIRAHLNDLLDNSGKDAATLAALRSGPFEFLANIVEDPGPPPAPVSKALFYGWRDGDFEAMRSGLEGTLEVLPASVAWYGPHSGEIMLPGIHKALGIELISRHFGIDQADTIGIGDGHNDIEMLQHVGVGIAMGNAPDAVKAVADEVTGSPSQDGIRAAFVRRGLVSEPQE